jgi:hypothetical protein
MTESQATPTGRRVTLPLAGLLLGLAPGVLLILAAQFAISGEPQLTVGTVGMWLAAAGGANGLLMAIRTNGRPPRRRLPACLTRFGGPGISG